MPFHWDKRKARRNVRLHGVTFEEACTAFFDPLAQVDYDPDHSSLEERSILLGYSYKGRLLVVVHSEEDEVFRIISARVASRRERQEYEEDK